MLDISLSTVRRRMREQGLSSTQPFASLSDEELDSIVSEIKLSHPQCGYRMMIGHLRSRGLKIQQDRVRTSLRRVDPEGTTVRWMAAIYRRKYSVKGPNSLWHIDGYHKLIRWKMVIHGGIDGFSRVPVYLSCSNNNRADTVFELFEEAVNCWGASIENSIRQRWRKCRSFYVYANTPTSRTRKR
ncbi:PREDICTED: uncharacterized protein LOC107339677 isoform X1 [Paramuricea clavata]|uniref:PREDICTED: uncharacterized protein LOC107339677 isoform X1 n=1 Tax=Paramuricea clavata TaxID=317549 RepID=A0A7D9M394_PARCT|nr:PREDICTED: uncharacterized protein LOC107339677 isoform X1 [Paramuricea clavata]